MPKAVLLVHAGAGQINQDINTQEAKQLIEALNTALQTGDKILHNGGNSLDAVEAAVKFLEDFPLFNAGKGADIAGSGLCELDASIMDGSNKRAGAVAGITVANNPISVARILMEKSEYRLFYRN